jgi:tetratricopeptide (TPR) repeat protein
VLLSAALIVRDEERCLARCLTSLQGIVDEVVLVDTGSVDATVEIAHRFGAVVLHRPWDGDFSAPRNLGLDHVQGTWVLYIDADEYLEATSRSHVEQQLADPTTHVSYRIRHRYKPGFTPYFEYRIWRNRPDIRFRGVIHETVVPDILRVAEREGLRIGEAELLLEHDGYEGDQRRKHERNLPLLLEQVTRDPKRTYLWDHIGRIHEAQGAFDEARQVWQTGIELVRVNGVREPADCLVYFDLICLNANQGRPDKALVDEATTLFPLDVLVLWAAALDAVARQANQETVDRISEMLAVSPELTAWRSITMDERIPLEWARHARGMAYFALGHFADAAADFDAAHQHNPEMTAYRVKRDLALAKVRRDSPHTL